MRASARWATAAARRSRRYPITRASQSSGPPSGTLTPPITRIATASTRSSLSSTCRYRDIVPTPSVTDRSYFPDGASGVVYRHLAWFHIDEDETVTAGLERLGYDAGDITTAVS